MALRSRLELRTVQRQRLSTGVHHLIQLLTLSNQELSDRVMEMLEENPLLELSGDAADIETVPLEDESATNQEFDSDFDFEAPDSLVTEIDTPGLDPYAELDSDIDWTELPPSIEQPPAGKKDTLLQVEDNPAEETLLGHLEWQLKTKNWTEQEKWVARNIFHALNEHGFLDVDLVELVHSDTEPSKGNLALYQEVLGKVQGFSPSGIAARDLQESLAIQLQDLPPSTDMREYAMDVVDNHFDLLADVNLEGLADAMELTSDEIQEIVGLIGSLNPRPASEFKTEMPVYVEPDVRVFKRDGNWEVEMIDSTMPSVQITPNHERYKAGAATREERNYLKQKEIDAQMLLDGINYRSMTILKTVRAIVANQQAFLEEGEGSMRPLIRAEIADEIGVHESTISRVTSNKYMETPRGIFELSYCFSSKVQTRSGGEVSSVAIRAMLKEFIDHEDRRKPLSDQKLMDMLQDRNIRVARRTVAKYREAMSIPSSSLRMAKAV